MHIHPLTSKPFVPPLPGSGLPKIPGRAPALAPLLASWQCDLADDRLTWSPGVYELFGLDPDAPLNRRSAVAMYDAESRTVLERLRSRAIANGESFTFEARIQRPSGEWRRMRLSADVVMANCRATHLYGSKQDITDEPA